MVSNIRISQALILTTSLVAGPCLFAGSPMNESFADTHETLMKKKRQAEDCEEIEPYSPHKKTRLSKEEEDGPSSYLTNSLALFEKRKERYSPTGLYKIMKNNPQQVAKSEELQELVADASYKGFLTLDNEKIDLLFPNLKDNFRKNHNHIRLAILFKKELITKEFIEELEQQARTNNPYAFYLLGIKEEEDKHYELSYAYYKKAAELELPEAQSKLGLLYINGQGIEQSDNEAIKWLTPAAKQGDAAAYFNLGLMHRMGKGVFQSDKEAVVWWTLGTKQGFKQSQFNLGFMYFRGQGVDQSFEETLRLWLLAAEQGYTKAIDNLSQLITIIPPVHTINQREFELSEGRLSTLDTYLAKLESLKERFNPERTFSDSYPQPYLHRSFEGLIKDIVQYRSLLPYINQSGFLISNIKPQYNICHSTREKPFLRAINLENANYYCVGERNVEAGIMLQKLLWRADEPTHSDVINFLKGIADVEDLDTAKAIAQLEELKDVFIDLMGVMRNAVKDYLAQRNQKFYLLFGKAI